MKSFSKLRRIIGNILFVVVIVLLISVTLVTLFSRIGGNGRIPVGAYGFGRVVTGSMEPDIPTGSFILIEKTDSSDLKIGDTITFFSDDPTVPNDRPVSHRIERIEADANGNRMFITKGTANGTEDIYPVYDDAIIGRVIFSSLTIGKLIGLSQTPYVYPVLILLLLLSMIQNIVDIVKQVIALRGLKESE